jgi:outer membrane autotransporter protein
VTEAKLESLRDQENGKPSTDTGKIATFGRWSVFSNISGEWFNQDRQAYSRERGFDGHRYGGTLGADYRLDEGSRIGVMVSYSQYSMNFDQELAAPGFTPPTDAGGMKSKTFSAVLFATGNFTDNAWIDAAGGFAWSDNDFRRNAVFQPANPRSPVTNTIVNTAGSANGRQWFVTLGAGYDFTDGALSIGPYVRGTYTHSKIDAYSEQDVGAVSGLAMRVAAQEAESFVGIAGARASYSIGTSWGVIVPQARVEYEHEFKDDARTTITRFVLDPSNTPLAVSSDAPDRNHFNLGATLSLVLPHGVITYVDYEALVGYSDFTRNRVTAGLRVEF